MASKEEDDSHIHTYGRDFFRSLAPNMERTNIIQIMRLSTDWSTLRVHGVGKNLALIFVIATTSILVSK